MVMTAVATHSESVVSLTERQVEILCLLLEGKSSKEVARSLYVSKRTVDFHLGRIYRMLNATNRVHAIRRATELGFVSMLLS